MRLDHLLSKEHHETHAPPTTVWGFGELSDSLDGPCPVVGSVRVHDKLFRSAGWAGGDCQTHYWALRQQARSPLCPVGWGTGGVLTLGGGARFAGVVVVAPSWWWGVVFDLWIVVASI